MAVVSVMGLVVFCRLNLTVEGSGTGFRVRFSRRGGQDQQEMQVMGKDSPA